MRRHFPQPDQASMSLNFANIGNNNMVYSWCLLVFSSLWLVCPVSSKNDEDDICDMYDKPMFCNCEYESQDEYSVTCFVFRSIDSTDELWRVFENVQKTLVALTFASRLPMQLHFVPTSALLHLPSLQTFTIQEGKLGSIGPYSISNLTQLTRLLLERNEITNLEPNAISHLPNLKKLILSENYFSEILADTLVDLLALEELFLDRNNISRIETCAFCSLHSLKELELWDNQLTDLTEHMFRGLRYLTRLDLYKNQIRVVNAYVFRSMPRLRELDLKENRIDHLSPRAFDGLANLLKLHLNDNRLKTLAGTVFQFPKKLMHIDISSNELSTLTAGVIENLANVENNHFSLRFKDNPLHCGCDLRWVAEYIERVKSTMFLRELHHAECRTKYGDMEKAVDLETVDDCDVETTVHSLTTQHVKRKSTIFNNTQVISSDDTFETFHSASDDSVPKTNQKADDMEPYQDPSDKANVFSCRDNVLTFVCTIFMGLLWKHHYTMNVWL